MEQEVSIAGEFYEHALSHFEGVMTDARHPLERKKYDGGFGANALPSQTGQAAFVCELALKSLLALQDGSVRKTHRLDVLYETLDKPHRMAIRDRMVNCGFSTRREFGPMLTKCANAFVEARYPGSTSYHWSFLRRLAVVLIDYVGKQMATASK